MSFIKNNFKYVFIFIGSLICMSFLLTYFDGDVLWNYGFSYAISKGEVPYSDFNMIITPVYLFLCSVPLLINSNILVFYITNSLLITIMFYFLDKLYGYKSYILLILLVFPIPSTIFPSYNLFLIFLVVVLIYLEKNKRNDYLIGFIIGLSILTKQSVGLFLIIPSIIYYRKDKVKLIKRGIGCFIPCIVFLVYLFFSRSFSSFINLCILGLFDFNGNNSFSFTIIIGILLILSSIYLFIKNKSDIKYLYVVMFSSIMIPLSDFNHIMFFVFVFSLLFLDKIKLSKRSIITNSVIFSVSFSLIFFYFTMGNSNINYPNKYNNFNYRLLYNKNGENSVRDSLIKYININKNKNIILISSDAYFYKITCNRKIDYFDLNNIGNHGFNGTKMMKKKIDKLEKGTIIIIDRNEVNNKKIISTQFNKKIAKYAMSKYKKIEKIASYNIYMK